MLFKISAGPMATELKDNRAGITAYLKNDTHISVFEGLSLNDYANARSYVCKARHSHPCQLYSGMIKVA